jgi:hypothetical protein
MVRVIARFSALSRCHASAPPMALGSLPVRRISGSRSHVRVPEIHRRMAQDPAFRRQIRPFCARIFAPQNVVNFVVS